MRRNNFYRDLITSIREFDPEEVIFDRRFMQPFMGLCSLAGALLAAGHIYFTDVVPGTPQRRTDECIATLTSAIQDKNQRTQINDFCYSRPVRDGTIDNIVSAYSQK